MSGSIPSGRALLDRAKKIRLPLRQIAREEKLDKHTVGRVGSANPQLRTLGKVHGCIERHELDLLAHLLALHGVPEHFRSKDRAA